MPDKREYTCLSENEFFLNDYTLIPIRDEDKYEIMDWRNTQIDILRQKHSLTKEQQETYFKKIVNSLFSQPQPDQILWSYLYKGELIGYGGLVHIDWDARNGEISFVLNNEHNSNMVLFKKDWEFYLKILEEIAFKELKFHKIYTYAYDIRDHYFDVMYKLGFVKEAHYKEHVLVKNKLTDVIVLSKMNVSVNER